MRISDWSSDVCSSDLLDRNALTSPPIHTAVVPGPVPGTHWRRHEILPCDRSDGGSRGSRQQVPGRQSLCGEGEASLHASCETTSRSSPRRFGNCEGSSAERLVGKEWVSTCISRGVSYQ